MRARMRESKCLFTSASHFVACLHRRSVGERRYLGSFRRDLRAVRDHWHASHVGSSTPQNLMSVAGVAPPVAASICARAAAAAASIALIAPWPLCAACMPPAPLPLLTAFRRPDWMVDFSACVALVVRR